MNPPTERQEPALEPPPLSVPQRRQPLKSGPTSLAARLFWTLLLAASILPGIVLALRWLPPPITSFMLQSETRPVHYRWVPASRIADSARKAVVAAEDQKFWVHRGFDIEAIEKAYAHNQKSRRQRGASTISQQTAKNLFLWPGGGYVRKAVEATITVLIEALWGKERILEVYLNIAEFGPGVYGVEAAAQLYFGKSAAALSVQEAAQLAAVLPSPRRWSASAPGAYVQKRARWILGQMGYRRQAPADEPEPLPTPLDLDDEMPAISDWPDTAPDGATEPLPDAGTQEALPEEMPGSASDEPVAEPAPAETPPDPDAGSTADPKSGVDH